MTASVNVPLLSLLPFVTFFLDSVPMSDSHESVKEKRNCAFGLRNTHLFCTTALVEIAPRVRVILSQSTGGGGDSNVSARMGGRQKFYRQSVPDIILIKQMDND